MIVKHAFVLPVTEETLREARIQHMRDDLHVTYDIAAKLVDACRPPTATVRRRLAQGPI